jgi:large subunit ribosomal protein L24
MKLKVGDEVIVTAGKDKGARAKILRVLPSLNKVVVQGINMYTRHMRPMGGQAGERVRKERPLDVAKVAIWNEETKGPDRVRYEVKDGEKVRVYAKTGKKI